MVCTCFNWTNVALIHVTFGWMFNASHVSVWFSFNFSVTALSGVCHHWCTLYNVYSVLLFVSMAGSCFIHVYTNCCLDPWDCYIQAHWTDISPERNTQPMILSQEDACNGLWILFVLSYTHAGSMSLWATHVMLFVLMGTDKPYVWY